MPPRSCRLLALLLIGLPCGLGAAAPVVSDDRLVLELVAEQPQIVTPTGLAVDEQGRVWVVENNTHQRGSDYKGPKTDRVRILSDLDAQGRARKVTTFADGFKDAMSLAFGPDGSLYLATRAEILLLQRKDDRFLASKSLVKLVTRGNYPHNGLCGFAFDPRGQMVFGMGENLGEPYRLVGADGTTLQGGGEGGNLFLCRPDGTGLTRQATGFWNPFHHTFDAFGRLFVVDNDPDARGPCRLLHVVPGGDYGYRFRYGRKGTHPFQCWNGELAGTLGMVAGTGEAPSGILAYEANNLPSDYRGDLLVTSWGDHTIERYRLLPAGASFRARMQTVVRGDEQFRPVAIATGPDGAVYFSDWVDRSYPVHGKGRVWRLRAKKPTVADDGLRPTQVATAETKRLAELLGDPRQAIRTAATRALAERGKAARPALEKILTSQGDLRQRLHALWAAASLAEGGKELIDLGRKAAEPELRSEAVRLGASRPDDGALKDASPAVRLQAILRADAAAVLPFLADADPFLVHAAVQVVGQAEQVAMLLRESEHASPAMRLGVLLALRKSGDARALAALPRFLDDADPEVRRAAMRWAGESRLQDLAGRLEAAATRLPTSPALLRSLLAARHLLAGGKPEVEPVEEKHLARLVHASTEPVAFRVLALQTLRPDHPEVAPTRLIPLLEDRDAALRVEVVRTLARRADRKSETALVRQASAAEAPADLRAEAILGLGALTEAPAVRTMLLDLLGRPELRRDALRSLRLAGRDPAVARALLDRWDQLELAPAERSELAAQMVLALKDCKDSKVVAQLPRFVELAGKRPTSSADWKAKLARGGDVQAGERVFYHPAGPGCYRCHTIASGGDSVGPDLTTIGSALSRDRLIESILEPGKEIAPRYVTWRIATARGTVHTGVILDEGAHSVITLGDNEGKRHTLHRKEIEERTALPSSTMPDGLADRMTPQEFQDLVAYLASRRGQDAPRTRREE
ncbi:MAG: PVC-type heme-binding CxxCH protein [Gemmataceae bacterium]